MKKAARHMFKLKLFSTGEQLADCGLKLAARIE
jgi:hypothetical protein